MIGKFWKVLMIEVFPTEASPTKTIFPFVKVARLVIKRTFQKDNRRRIELRYRFDRGIELPVGGRETVISRFDGDLTFTVLGISLDSLSLVQMSRFGSRVSRAKPRLETTSEPPEKVESHRNSEPVEKVYV
jgi:hypothetical protein